MVDPNIIAFQGHLRLQRWSESSKAGKKVIFRILGEMGSHPFRKFTVRDKSAAGQRFMVSLVPLEDAESPHAFNGELLLLDWNDSSSMRRTVIFEVNAESEENPFALFETGNDGQIFASVFVEVNNQEKPVEQQEKVSGNVAKLKPYGHFARDLHKTNWFLNPNLLPVVGSPREFLDWLKGKPCACGCGSSETMPVPVNNSQTVSTFVPGCRRFAETPQLLSNNKATAHYRAWVEERVCSQLGVESMGFAKPATVIEWARHNKIFSTLPRVYRDVAGAKLASAKII